MSDFKTLCTPDILTAMQKETVDLYWTALKKDRRLMEKHASEYFWIRNSWITGSRLDARFFIDRAERLKEEGVDFRKERAVMIESLNELKRKKDALRKKFPRLSKETESMIDFFDRMTVWRERRKKCSMITTYFLSVFC